MAEGKRKWRFSVDPDGFSQIYFNDPDDNPWHVLRWEHAPKVPVPFSLDALRQLRLRSTASCPVNHKAR